MGLQQFCMTSYLKALYVREVCSKIFYDISFPVQGKFAHAVGRGENLLNNELLDRAWLRLGSSRAHCNYSCFKQVKLFDHNAAESACFELNAFDFWMVAKGSYQSTRVCTIQFQGENLKYFKRCVALDHWYE